MIPNSTFSFVMLKTQVHKIHACRTSCTPLNKCTPSCVKRSPSSSLPKISVQLLQHLPLRLLLLQERFQNSNNPPQRCQPRLQLTLHPLLIPLSPKLRIEILSIRTRRHRSAEDRLHHERMVGFEGVAVRGTEGGRQLFGGSGEVLGEGNSREV